MIKDTEWYLFLLAAMLIAAVYYVGVKTDLGAFSSLLSNIGKCFYRERYTRKIPGSTYRVMRKFTLMSSTKKEVTTQFVNLILNESLLCACGKEASVVTGRTVNKNRNSLNSVQVYCHMCYQEFLKNATRR